jgi:hypothetical protein
MKEYSQIHYFNCSSREILCCKLPKEFLQDRTTADLKYLFLEISYPCHFHNLDTLNAGTTVAMATGYKGQLPWRQQKERETGIYCRRHKTHAQTTVNTQAIL